MRNAVKHHPWLAAPLAVCLAVLVMDITGTVHPPGTPDPVSGAIICHVAVQLYLAPVIQMCNLERQQYT